MRSQENLEMFNRYKTQLLKENANINGGNVIDDIKRLMNGRGNAEEIKSKISSMDAASIVEILRTVKHSINYESNKDKFTSALGQILEPETLKQVFSILKDPESTPDASAPPHAPENEEGSSYNPQEAS